MENIRDIFKTSNTEDVEKRNNIIQEYKELNNIPENHGINIADIIKWKENNNKII